MPAYQFYVLSKDVAHTLSNQLQVHYTDNGAPPGGLYGALGAPCSTDDIVTDGNCFFRAISQVVCGSQDSHHIFRHNIVQHMMCNEELVADDMSDTQPTENPTCPSSAPRSQPGTTSKYIRNRKRLDSKRQYHADTTYRHLKKTTRGKKYQGNPPYKARVKAAWKRHYNNHDMYKTKLLNTKKQQYKTNTSFKKARREASIALYARSYKHRRAMREARKHKYNTSDQHKSGKREASITKYYRDRKHRCAVKNASITKYYRDRNHRRAVKNTSITKYRTHNPHTVSGIAGGARQAAGTKLNKQDFACVLTKFNEDVQHGPNYVCNPCQRFCFRKQVVRCKRKNYQHSSAANTAAAHCITERFLHK
ncbi:hypothetical protein KUCAC02_004753 [Chaenocephalus aceratus]|uniref:Uncharacterized protein n=1 Tax=Chaenocephalus aceratus TaxID=36190 RepID=A0ACB9X0N8_CHAAC|nr:hypothetical protein KUCAC02_004753 [Chaenocephalus aceratus]